METPTYGAQAKSAATMLPKIKTSPAQSPWQNRHQLLNQLDVPRCFDCFKDGTSDKITYLTSLARSNQS